MSVGHWSRSAVALSLLLTACAPPQTITPPGSQPGTASGLPASAPSSAVGTPTAGTATAHTALAAQVVFPAGTWLKLKHRLSTQSLVNPEDITAADLASLSIQVNGVKLTADQFAFGRLEWGPNGELVATLNLVNLTPDKPSLITISNASGSVALEALVDTNAKTTVQIDVSSTARVLIMQAMAQKGMTVVPADIDPRAVALVANQLTQAMVSSAGNPVMINDNVIGVVDLVSRALGSGSPATLDATLAGAAQQSGGGSGAGAPAGTTTTSGAAWSRPATGMFTDTQAPFGFPQPWTVASIGTTLYTSFSGMAELHVSTDQGHTWTRYSRWLNVGRLLADGTTLYGAAFDPTSLGGQVWKLDTTTGNVTTLDRTGLPAHTVPVGLVLIGSTLAMADRETGKVYLKDLNGGPWTQFGLGNFNGLREMISDGTHLYISSDAGLHQLALATPGGSWTLLSTGPNAPTYPYQLAFAGGMLYATADVGLCRWDGTAWTAETAAAGFLPRGVWTDGTDLVASGLKMKTYTANGANTYDYDSLVYQRPLASPNSWNQLGDTLRAADDFFGGSLAKLNGDMFMGLQRLTNGGTHWAIECLANACYTFSEAAAAGGYVWVLDDDKIWRISGTGGSWTRVETGLPAGWLRQYIGYGRGNLVGTGNQLFLALGPEVYTLDASQASPTWSLFGGTAPDQVTWLAMDETNLYARGATRQVYQIPLTGGTWTPYGPVMPNFIPRAMKAANGHLYAFDRSAGLLYELAGSAGTWTAAPTLSGLSFFDMLVSASRVLVFGTPSDGQSDVRQWDGTQWSAMPGAPVEEVTGTAVGTDGYYLYSPPYGLHKLPFGASSWQLVDGYKYRTNAMVFEPISGHLFELTEGNGIQRTL